MLRGLEWIYNVRLENLLTLYLGGPEATSVIEDALVMETLVSLSSVVVAICRLESIVCDSTMEMGSTVLMWKMRFWNYRRALSSRCTSSIVVAHGLTCPAPCGIDLPKHFQLGWWHPLGGGTQPGWCAGLPVASTIGSWLKAVITPHRPPYLLCFLLHTQQGRLPLSSCAAFLVRL